jgi:hypothetical protein
MRWLPQAPARAVAGSAGRVLIKQDGAWIWEGKPINPAELED